MFVKATFGVSTAQQAVRHFQRAEQFFHNLFDEAQVLTEPWLVFSWELLI